MTSEWHEVPLRELVGYISKGIAPSYAEEASETTIRVLNQKCNRNFRISYGDSRLHDTLKKKVPPERYVKPDDILINSTGAGTAGRIAQIEDVPSATTIDGHMILIRSNRKVTQKFLGYALKAHQWEVLQLDEGSTGQTELNRDRLLDEIMINYPVSFDEQNAIVGTLESIDRKLIVNEQLNDNLEQQAATLFKALFVDLTPFDGTMPPNWTISTLGDATEMGAGGDKPKESSPVKTPLCPYPIYSNGINDYGLYGYTNDPKIKVESVTVSARGTIGYVCLRHTPYVPIVRLVTLIPDTKVLSAKYLYLYLRQLHITGTGTTQQQLTVPDFRKTEIIIPDKNTMDSFTETVTPLFEQIWANEDENTKLAEVRDALLPKLMSGEIDVSDIQL